MNVTKSDIFKKLEQAEDKKKMYYEKGKTLGKKYEIVEDDTLEIGGKKLHRIRSLQYLGDPVAPLLCSTDLRNKWVNPGDLGGYIESEANLDQKGKCWVYDSTIVAENARIMDDAVVGGNSLIQGNAIVKNRAIVDDGCMITGNAVIGGYARVLDKSTITDNCVLELNSSAVRSTLRKNVNLGYCAWAIYSTLDGDIEILKEYEENKNECRIEGSTLTGKVIIKNVYTNAIANSKIKDITLENIESLEINKSHLEFVKLSDNNEIEISNSLLYNSNITGCNYVNIENFIKLEGFGTILENTEITRVRSIEIVDSVLQNFKLYDSDYADITGCTIEHKLIGNQKIFEPGKEV